MANLTAQQQLFLDYCLNGQVAEAEALLKAGVPPNTRDNLGRTALMLACMQGDTPELVALLLEYGANPALIDQEGRTAIDYATQAQAQESLRLLQGYPKKPVPSANPLPTNENTSSMDKNNVAKAPSTEVLEAILQVCDELKGLHPEVNPFIYFKKASVYLQMGRRHEAQKLLHITFETFKEAYGDATQAAHWRKEVKELYMQIIRLKASLQAEAIYENMWLYNEAYHLAEEPELRFEMREKRDELYRRFVNGALRLNDKKAAFLTDDLPLEEPEIVLPLIEGATGIFRFLHEAPQKGNLYLLHPYRRHVAYPFKHAYGALLEDKVNELVRILQHLGAQKIEIFHETLPPDPAADSDRPADFLYELHPTQRPHIPSDVVWYPYETEWQRMVKQRMQGAIFSAEFVCSIETLPTLSDEELDAIDKDLAMLMQEQEHASKRKKGKRSSKASIPKAEIHRPALQYRIRVHFSPLDALTADIKMEEIPTIDVQLLRQGQLTPPDVTTSFKEERKETASPTPVSGKDTRVEPIVPKEDNESAPAPPVKTVEEKAEEPLVPPPIRRDRPEVEDVLAQKKAKAKENGDKKDAAGSNNKNNNAQPTEETQTHPGNFIQSLTQEEKFYFEMLQHAYQDGEISADIRKVLDRRRERLQISLERAQELEEVVKKYYSPQ
ncbi:MAG: hypothetical protein KatS3mg033_1330 [Thermonema sp.]|uniref:ankyrin repeat domain-containing protein n=1 Tax=Thermonema sp. TaxID=2231181 RepID=UPI0021DEE090|nr:ankyrin repeat domain-containing protein [Thermonema sp.]GIV39530.1 MAG: hypothetical protein KatS3mg033_1330 [Thermonema sp.]